MQQGSNAAAGNWINVHHFYYNNIIIMIYLEALISK